MSEPATPQAQFIGVQPTDISDTPPPTNSPEHINAPKAEPTDPRFATDYWHTQINL